jgi:hypothetical protein
MTLVLVGLSIAACASSWKGGLDTPPSGGAGAIDQSSPEGAVRSYFGAFSRCDANGVRQLLVSPDQSAQFLQGIEALASAGGRIEISDLELQQLSSDDSTAEILASDRNRILGQAGTVLRDWRSEQTVYRVLRRDGKWYLMLRDSPVITK